MRHSKKLAALAIAAGVAITASAAYAYWSASGGGTGTAATRAGSQDITVKQTSSNGDLYPGGPAATLSGNFDNPNPFRVGILSVTASVTGTHKVVGGQNEPNPDCGAANFEVSSNGVDFAASATAANNAQRIASGLAQGSWSGLSVRMKDLDANQDACKNAVVDLAYSVTAG